MLKPFLLTCVAVLICNTSKASPEGRLWTQYELSLGELYVAAYSDLAVTEMKRMAIPASIILSQGMLESGFGKSQLAVKANNHFGIKCHNGWQGETYTHLTRENIDGEIVSKTACFRQYATVEDSYKDHSEFLASRSNYTLLFLEKSTDYKFWAEGLQKAGYATDAEYAQKLINTIQKYSLNSFDNQNTVLAYNQSTEAQEYKEKLENLKNRIVALESIVHNAEMYRLELKEMIGTKNRNLELLEMKHNTLKNAVNEKIKILDNNLAGQYRVIDNFQTRLQRVENIQQNIIKSDPLAVYFNEDGTPKQTIDLFPTQQLDSEGIFYQSGRKATIASADRNLLEIANEYDIHFKDLLKFNDLDDDADLPEGHYVYLELKANYVDDEKKPHQVVVGETVHTISQRYGIKAARVYQRNSLRKGEEPEVGEFIFLNKSNGKRPKIKSTPISEADFNAGGSNR